MTRPVPTDPMCRSEDPDVEDPVAFFCTLPSGHVPPHRYVLGGKTVKSWEDE